MQGAPSALPLRMLLPDMERFCPQNNLPFKILWVLDNACVHPPVLIIFVPHPHGIVACLPISLLQPMSQSITSCFEKYYM